MTVDGCSHAFLASIQPVVLAGGKSVRFGRDKLREPFPTADWPLVRRPVEALRAVFGGRVRLVGDCHDDLRGVADGVIADEHPGVGPIGGIVSALRSHGGAGGVFVLAGDMPGVTGADVLHVLAAAERNAEALAVLASTDRAHPCFGLYRPGALEVLAARVAAGDSRLTDALPAERVRLVACAPRAVANINRPADLGA